MALETHLSPATSNGNVLMASEVHLTPSTSHGNTNCNLAPIDKFNYLDFLLVKSAGEAISGLSLTAANYDETIEEKVTGNKKWIINRRKETLLNIKSVKSCLNMQALHQLHDLIVLN